MRALFNISSQIQGAFAEDGDDDQGMRPDPYVLPPQSGLTEKTEYDVSIECNVKECKYDRNTTNLKL